MRERAAPRGWLLGGTLALGLLLPVQAHAKAYFADKKEMVREADLIALVEITRLKKLEPEKSCGTDEARAKLIHLVKGSGAAEITFRVPCFFPCAIVNLKPGRHLVFLKEREGILQGNNWHLSYRPVTAGEVEWYEKGPGQLKKQPLLEVLADVQSLRKGGARRCSPLPEGDVSWPAKGVWITPSDVASKQRRRISREDAAQIRCALERRMHTADAARAVPADLGLRVVTWRVGGLDGAGPRVGTFWVSLDVQGREIVLRNTLGAARPGRHGLVARLRKARGRWRVVHFAHWRATHSRR